jgi:RNA polymerase sigma factor (sigma-70 family)
MLDGSEETCWEGPDSAIVPASPPVADLLGNAMQERDESQTSPTLLGRVALQPADQDAWNTFVDRYAPKIVGWCRAWGLPGPDVEDVTQAVLTKLVVRLRRFRYDPSKSFRGFLRTVTQGALIDALAARGPIVPGGGSEVLQSLTSVEARVDLAERLEEEYDRELLAKAMERVQQRVLPHNWEAFRLTAVEGLSGAETAGRLHIQVAAVYVAKSSVMKMLKEELVVLDQEPSLTATG